MRRIAAALATRAAIAIAAPAVAQDHSMHDMQGMQGMHMPGMTMPAPAKKPPVKFETSKRKAASAAKKQAPATPPTSGKAPGSAAGESGQGQIDHSKMDHSNMPGMNMSGGAQASAPGGASGSEQAMGSMQMTADPHAGHNMSGMAGMPGMAHEDVGQTGTALPAGNAPPPAKPSDHAADRVYGSEAMAMGRHHLTTMHGGQNFSQVLLNLAEYQFHNGRDGYRWDGEAWFGGDINRLFLKSEGEGAFGDGIENAEVQALYSRAIGPYFNLQAGVRQDLGPSPDRTYATVGFEGLAPGYFEVEGAAYLSNKGDLLARLEGYYDQRVTQRLILQPRAELNFAAQDVPENRIGSGLSDVELGLRLRYEIKREFAPYVGVSWERQVGDTARFARAAGEGPTSRSVVAGVRLWF